MIHVYSQQRPARPQWAVPSGIVLLVATLGMAVGLIAVKRQSLAFELETPMDIGGGMRAALPAGWREIAEEGLPRGVVWGLTEPPSDGNGAHLPRRLLFFRLSPVSPALPSAYALAAARQMALQVVPGMVNLGDVAVEDSLDPIGPYSGCTVYLAGQGISQGQPTQYHIMARAAVTPRGQVFGVVLSSVSSHRNADRKLLSEICDQFTFAGEPITEDAPAALADAGISFSPLPSIRAVRNDEPGVPRCVLTAGSGEDYWAMEIHRLPLIDGRPVEELLTDYVSSELALTRPDVVINRTTVGRRELLSTTFEMESFEHPLGFVWAMDTGDADTALLFVACAEPGGVDEMAGTVRGIAGEAEVSPYGDIANIALARRNGQRLLDALGKMDSRRLRLLNRGLKLTYRLSIADMDYGESMWIIDQENNGNNWLIANSMTMLEWNSNTRVEQNWTVRKTDLSHTRSVSVDDRKLGSLRDTPVLEYVETRFPQRNVVECRLDRFDKQLRRARSNTEFATGNTYTCQPVLLEAFGQLAIEPDAQPAMLTLTEPYGVSPRHWIAVPIGRRRLPDGEGPEADAWAVRMHCDCEATGGLWYFDDGGRWLATVWDNGVTETLVDEDS